MANFNEIVRQKTPVLIDFYANWCAPCKMMPPILKQVKSELGEKVKILKIDVDKNPQIALKYNIRSIPTMMLFKEGETKWITTGVTQANQIISKINSII
ncbi:MAG: thioredoxin [Chlorobi bacterium]|nr:thioredoxin [Chlorobiota bacterium]